MSLADLCHQLVCAPEFQAHRARAIDMWSAQRGKCRPSQATHLEWNEHWEREMWWHLSLLGMVADALKMKGIPASCDFNHDMYGKDPIHFKWVCALRSEGVCIGSQGDVPNAKMRRHIQPGDECGFELRELPIWEEDIGQGSLLDLFRQFPRVPEEEKDFFKSIINQMGTQVEAHLLGRVTVSVLPQSSRQRL